MRSQASKPLPKKGALSKTTFKPNSPTRQVKKKVVTAKKVKNLVKKSLVKSPKKNTSKDDTSDSKTDESSAEDKTDSSSEAGKAGTSKSSSTRSDSPTKKAKKEPKEKKESVKTVSDSTKTAPKKPLILVKKTKSLPKPKKKDENSDDVKYKLNLDIVQKGKLKLAKPKAIAKKGTVANPKKKSKPTNKQESKESPSSEDIEAESKTEQEIKDDKVYLLSQCKNQPEEAHIEKEDKKDENKVNAKTNTSENPASTPTTSNVPRMSTETSKVESERPPKFFTSSRSPRTVDIDVKCCKNSKGNLTVSERFISLKHPEPKVDESNKDKNNASNNLISQGPEIDVYTFTEKVDSPKSILSDFRNPINKNVGRVRPIARVKGTVIDKRTETEKKKYSPHRPIEEVVKQLKAKKGGAEDLKSHETATIDIRTSLDSCLVSDEKEDEEKPKPIISKSYKMVARKTSIPGKPFSPIKFLDQEEPAQTKGNKSAKSSPIPKRSPKSKGKSKSIISDEDIDNSKFALNTKSLHYYSSEESHTESNDDNDTKESSESETSKNKKTKKTKKYKRITDSAKKKTSKELKELSKDSLIDLKDESVLLGNEKPSKRRLKLLSMWSGPKKHRMASLNAIAKVHCLYENESRTHMELGLMKTVGGLIVPSIAKPSTSKKKETKPKDTEEKQETTSESEYERKGKKEESSEDDSTPPPTRSLRGVPGIRSAGKYWDPKSSTSSSEDSGSDSKKKKATQEKKKISPKISKSDSSKSDSDKPPAKMKKTTGVPVKKQRKRNEVTMDLKDMVVQKRMASLNATAILAASYEKRSPKSSNKDETTSDSYSDESFSQKSKNGVSSGVKSEAKIEEKETKKEIEEPALADRKQKVEVIVNQDTDVTITGVYSTHHHEGFCTVSGMQYRISSTSHTQTTATANCEKEGCPREDGARYTPLTALSSMQPPADHAHQHPHPVPELGGLARRAAGCSSAFSAPSPAAHHDPGKPKPQCNFCDPMTPVPVTSYGYYQPAGPLIKETGADAERALARYHPAHYHAPHPPVLQQYGPYYPADLCYAGRYYRPQGPYHMPPPPQPDSQMVGVGGEPYPPPQYYGGPPCYQHSPQRVPYIEYRGCPCPMNACPKNVLIGPATGKAPTGGGPADVPSAHAPPGGAFRAKVRAACAIDAGTDTHGSGKDPPLEPEPPAAADAPRPCPLPAIGGASPKRELYDVRDNLRLAGDMSGSAETVGPPSPARGSAGACAPQPPPVAPRRARLGKAMARRSLAGDDTGLLISTPQAPPSNHSDGDDDVMAISPPVCAPIDLSSSDETERRSTPLVDVKKENEGPTFSPPRKTDTQALKEHNCSAAETVDANNAAKAVKRRYSRPKLEIELGEVQLEDGCRTNGIGEHVKLQKRRKVSSEQHDLANRTETITTKESKRKSPKAKRAPKTATTERKTIKRKLEIATETPQNKKMNVEKSVNEDARLKNIAALALEQTVTKPKNKSALLLDNLIRKNSIDRVDSTEINPAELFLSVKDSPQNCTKKSLNINNNIIENSAPVNGVRPKTIAAVSQMIEKKLAASKSALKVQKVESKITQCLKTDKSVLIPPTDKLILKDDNKSNKVMSPCDITIEKETVINAITDKFDDRLVTRETNVSVSNKPCAVDNVLKTPNKTIERKSTKATKSTPGFNKPEDSIPVDSVLEEPAPLNANEVQERLEPTIKKQSDAVEVTLKSKTENTQPSKITVKNRSKLSIDKINGDLKAKNAEKTTSEKVAKLLVSKKSVIKTDEAALLVEDACASPVPTAVRRARRRRSGPKRTRRMPTLLPPPETDESRVPRWSNGWHWDGEHYLSKVYLNNDTRQDRTARCWSRMTHDSGDLIARGDCVLLRASPARAQPFVARVARLWENPEDGEMMVSLVWYYRPEHTERGRQPDDAPDEVFASRHRDANSVACIEDKCYVLTFNEYCRYRKRLKAAEEGVTIAPSIVPPMPASEVLPAIATNDSKLSPSVSPELVLFCRKIYDFRSKKLQVPNK